MLILVCSNNFVFLFVGWEGVGVASYLLINFWFTRIQASKASMQALLMNRIGDWGLSIGLFIQIWLFSSSSYDTIFGICSEYNEQYLTYLTIFLLIAAIGKSAQLGLHTWLPSAMEGERSESPHVTVYLSVTTRTPPVHARAGGGLTSWWGDPSKLT